MQKNYPKTPGIYRIIINNKSYIGATLNLRDRIQKHKSYLKNNTHHNNKLQRAYNKFKLFKIEVLENLDTENRKVLLSRETYFHNKYDSITEGYNFGYPKEIQERFTLRKEQITKAISKTCKKVKIFDRYTGRFVKEFNSVSEAAKAIDTSSSNVSRVCKKELNHIKGHTCCYSDDFDCKKDYSFPNDHKKGKRASKSTVLKQITGSKRAKKVYVYDLNLKLIKEFSSRRQCEKFFNFRNEFLRRRVDKETPLEGYFFKSIEI